MNWIDLPESSETITNDGCVLRVWRKTDDTHKSLETWVANVYSPDGILRYNDDSGMPLRILAKVTTLIIYKEGMLQRFSPHNFKQNGN